MISKRHGGPYDRGSADSYYGRKYSPHYYRGDTYSSARIESDMMTTEELVAYELGWNENEASGNFKEW